MSFHAFHLVPAPRHLVWEWHSHPGAVERLTPPFLPMSPLTQATDLRDGETRFRLPAGLQWRAQHQPRAFAAGRRFQDLCVNPPLAQVTRWRHTHSFIDHPAGTLVEDSVRTTAPAALIKSAFAYRQQQLIHDVAFLNHMADLAPDTAALHGGRPLTVAVTGSHGGVGRRLCAQLETAGHRVIRLVRSAPTPGADERRWDPDHPAADLFTGVDAVAHLAGAPIFGRFTTRHKEEIYSSRVAPTEKLAQLAAHTDSVRTFVTASAIGFYGADRGDVVLTEDDVVLTEDSERGDGFLADVVSDWEAACRPAHESGTTRVVNVRTGISLAGDSGLLPLLKAAFSTGLGGPFGDGRFWFSWVGVDDLTDVYVRALVDADSPHALRGPVNATAPHPMTNRDMAHALGEELHRPAVIPLPTWGPALLLGQQGADELALADQKVAPAALQRAGHTFRYPHIDAALRHELGGERLWAPGQATTQAAR